MCEMFHKLPLHGERLENKKVRSFVLNGRQQGFVRLKRGLGREHVAQTNPRPYVGPRPKRELHSHIAETPRHRGASWTYPSLTS